ncbi:Nn.00g052350.m01.CDS01 [Neocucurbitaria sp. VM-36]
MALLNWLTGKPKAPEHVLTDTVVPLNRHDDNRANRSISLQFTMRFDEVLDAEKLSGALWKLLERPGWRKLGARLRLNDEGKLEYHIPAQYTEERPPINYTHVKHDVPLSQHPLSSKFPRPNGTLQVFEDLDPLLSIIAPETDTTKLADWIHADKAQLGLYIVTFTDTTIVTLTWLHTLLDALGRKALLRAWVAMLEGREDDIPEFWGYDFDPLEKLGAPCDKESLNASDATNEEEFVLKDKRVQGWSLFKFVVNYLWEQFFYPQEVGRYVVMPPSYFAAIKKQAFNDLNTAPPSLLTMNTLDAKNPKPFLSDGDILCAWFMRLLASSNRTIVSSLPSRTVAVMNIYGLRDLLTSTSPQLLPKGKAYIANCSTAILSFFTQRDLLSIPLGHLAAQLRKDLVQQGTRAQVEAGQRLIRENKNQPVLYGTSDMAMCVFTNWCKAKLFETDFSAAIVREASVEQGKKHVRGRPVYIQAHSTVAPGFTVRGAGSCVGQDNEGNYWVGMLMRKEFGPDFTKAVEGLR